MLSLLEKEHVQDVYDEIADQLQIPLGTVKSRIFLARKNLSQKLEVYRN